MRLLSAISRRQSKVTGLHSADGLCADVCYHLASPRKQTVSEPPKSDCACITQDFCTKVGLLKFLSLLRAEIRCRTKIKECTTGWPSAPACPSQINQAQGRTLQPPKPEFPRDPTCLKAPRCMRTCKVSGPNRTKLFHVIPLYPIAGQFLTKWLRQPRARDDP